MTYEYEYMLCFEDLENIPRKTRAVEIYGTMPEAQEFIQEEFGLPGLPPAYALAPPANPRTDPYRRVTTIPIPTAMGNGEAQKTFFEKNRGWFIAAATIAGGYLIARALGLLGNKKLFANPPIKDVKYQEAGGIE